MNIIQDQETSGGDSTARIAELLERAESLFPGGDAALSRKEAERILCRVLAISRLDLLLSMGRQTTVDEAAAIWGLFKRRMRGEPIQYILGEAHFRALTLAVGPEVLIPRPETELLAGKAIELGMAMGGERSRKPRAAGNDDASVAGGIRVLDVGTGSGAVALSIATEIPDSWVVGADLHRAALAYAVANAARIGCRNVRFVRGDLCEAFVPRSFDIVVANLPYIAEGERAGLPREVEAFEPSSALFGGGDGLDMVRRLVDAAPRILRPGGWLLLEIGAAQAQGVMSAMRESGSYHEPTIVKDHNGWDRIVCAECVGGSSIPHR